MSQSKPVQGPGGKVLSSGGGEKESLFEFDDVHRVDAGASVGDEDANFASPTSSQYVHH